MFGIGRAKPVYMIIARIKTAAGAIAWERVRDTEAIVRNNIDMTKVNMKDIKTKKKKFPGCRFKLTMKYSVRLKTMALHILYGRSVSIDATASHDGWYSAYLECFSTIGRWA
jgi:hypothetical protein